MSGATASRRADSNRDPLMFAAFEFKHSQCKKKGAFCALKDTWVVNQGLALESLKPMCPHTSA